jgi:hypothetical protein
MRYLILLSLLTGCTAPLMLTGVGVASVGVTETTGKGIADHALSSVNNKDCKISRALNNQQVCQEPPAPAPVPIINKVEESDEIAKMEAVFARRRANN